MFGSGAKATAVAGLLLSGIAFLPSPTHADGQISGRVEVVDGDTLAMGALRIRLAGIDAPEREQNCALPHRDGTAEQHSCGLSAAEALRQLLGGPGASVACLSHQTDRDGQLVAECWPGPLPHRGPSLSKMMVRDGWALPFHYSRRFFDAANEAARRKVGIWAYRFLLPCRHRALSFDDAEFVNKGLPIDLEMALADAKHCGPMRDREYWQGVISGQPPLPPGATIGSSNN